jgi:RNA polymerase sigma-B factor
VLPEALNAAQVYRLASLNAPAGGADGAELIDLIGADDLRYAGVDDQLARIGAEIGISQMHVSRLLRRALTQLRAGLLVSADLPPEERPTHAHR